MGEKGVKYLEKVPTFLMDGPKSASIGDSNRACMMQHITHSAVDKVENILKGSLDSIPSPSPFVKIQIRGGKVRLRRKGKTLLGVVNKLLSTMFCLYASSKLSRP